MRKITLSDRAKSELKGLDPPVAKRISNKLNSIVDDIDNLSIKPLKGKLKGYYRIKLNDDYRAIFFVDGEEIIVMSIGHRKDIYR
ncbi:MAG: type II toxin-antitoxin system RelE/ParE family toxin [Nitrospirae bacterium]|nr:type II toxin-antitoxin system RelE/ParE family toxin [Nitrospirota bacterium]